MTPLESVYKAIQAFLVRNLKKQKGSISKTLIVVQSYNSLLLGIQTAQAYIYYNSSFKDSDRKSYLDFGAIRFSLSKINAKFSKNISRFVSFPQFRHL